MSNGKKMIFYQTEWLSPDDREEVRLFTEMKLDEYDGKHHASGQFIKSSSESYLHPLRRKSEHRSLKTLEPSHAKVGMHITSCATERAYEKRSPSPAGETKLFD